MTKQRTAITPTRAENYAEWYQEVVKKADLAEISPVRGCMVIKPWGYALWENIQRELDRRFKETGHQNIYCPLFIPKSFLEREAMHIEGFAKECAVVTHSRLAKNEKGELVPMSPLEEPLIVRPTSETIIGEMFSRWVHSYRDLPLLTNQWANIVRWEMRTRMFLRTTEFLWQEGHTAHANADEAQKEALMILALYKDFVEGHLAIPVIEGEKTANERFPGAVDTYCLEAMMQDKKALQAGTSHFLGQNFSKAFNVKFLDKDSKESYCWTTSWGVSTRLIGGLIMTHSDDDGLVLPPRLAPLHVIIIPVLHGKVEDSVILDYCNNLMKLVRAEQFDQQSMRVEVDQREMRAGDKGWSWVKKGVPLRLEIGAREVAEESVVVSRRDQSYQSKQTMSLNEFVSTVSDTLNAIQQNLWDRALAYQQANSVKIATPTELKEFFDAEQQGGFAWLYWHEDSEIEAQLKNEFKITPRCLPLALKSDKGPCIFTGKPGRMTVFAKAY